MVLCVKVVNDDEGLRIRIIRSTANRLRVLRGGYLARRLVKALRLLARVGKRVNKWCTLSFVCDRLGTRYSVSRTLSD